MCADDEVLLLQESMLQTRIPDEFRSVHACVGITASVIGTDVGTQCRTPWCGDGKVASVVEVPRVHVCFGVLLVAGMLVVETTVYAYLNRTCLAPFRTVGESQVRTHAKILGSGLVKLSVGNGVAEQGLHVFYCLRCLQPVHGRGYVTYVVGVAYVGVQVHGEVLRCIQCGIETYVG